MAAGRQGAAAVALKLRRTRTRGRSGRGLWVRQEEFY